eukprot:2679813-Rhodomonas_salina.4
MGVVKASELMGTEKKDAALMTVSVGWSLTGCTIRVSGFVNCASPASGLEKSSSVTWHSVCPKASTAGVKDSTPAALMAGWAEARNRPVLSGTTRNSTMVTTPPIELGDWMLNAIWPEYGPLSSKTVTVDGMSNDGSELTGEIPMRSVWTCEVSEAASPLSSLSVTSNSAAPNAPAVRLNVRMPSADKYGSSEKMLEASERLRGTTVNVTV